MRHLSDSTDSKTSDPRVVKDIGLAIAKLKSIRDGDMGVVDAIDCGSRAVPMLRDVLFAREPSGLYEARRRAVTALMKLRAYTVLIDYLRLSRHRKISDPVERIGEEAVINAAARAVVGSCDRNIKLLLFEFTNDRPLAGIVQALGELHCDEALPYFIKALAEDFTRPAAEEAIRKLGPKARAALLDAATLRAPSAEQESVSSIRRRRSALGLLAKLGPMLESDWGLLRGLLNGVDSRIAILTCQIILASGIHPDKILAINRLIDLLPSADALLRQEIERSLTENFELVAQVM